MTLAQAIGKRVANLLAERNFNQYYLYKNGGIPKSTVSETISAKKKQVRFGKFVKRLAFRLPTFSTIACLTTLQTKNPQTVRIFLTKH